MWVCSTKYSGNPCRELLLNKSFVQCQNEAIEAFRNTRNPEDFGVLVDMNYDRVLGTVERVVLNVADSRDIVQETFITAYSKFDSFRGESTFTTWVTGIAVRKAIGFMRKRSRFRQVETVCDSSVSGHGQPVQTVILSEDARKLDRAICSLLPELRAAITLTVVDQLSGADAARVCGCTRSTLYWRIHKARKLLAKEMESQTDD